MGAGNYLIMRKEVAEQILTENRESYNKMAKEFSASRGKFWEELAFLAEHATPKMRALDIGCGNGRFYPLLHARGAVYTGLDNSKGLLDEARRGHPEGTFIEGDATALPFPDESFDIAYSFAVIHHIPSSALREKFATEAARVLMPGSTFVITTWDLWSPRHVLKFLQSAIKNIFELSPLDIGDAWLTFGKAKQKRYLHAFTIRELEGLLMHNGFTIVGTEIIERKSGEKNIVTIAKKN
jgi:ubiquinone/menaquinone biosynthesis C-methylase UbiE